MYMQFQQSLPRLFYKGKPALNYPLDFHKSLPEIIQKGTCHTESVKGFKGALQPGFGHFLLRGLTSFWGPRVIVWALNDTDFLQRAAGWTLSNQQSMHKATGSDHL